jgi:class 3 adenylate cyclase
MVTAGGSAMASQTPTDHKILLGCLPRFRRDALDPRSGRLFPSVASAPAAVLRSDIVGFTGLTDRMVSGGIAGAEQLADVLNRIINRMAEIASAHGGELVNWEGDAGKFVWFAREDLSLEEATLLAVQSASAIHREAEAWLIDGAAIRFRSAVSCGLLSHFEIGGKDDEWHAALTGETLSDVIRTERAAAPSEIALSRSAVERIGSRCQWVPASAGAARLLSVSSLARPLATRLPPGDVPDKILRKAVPRILRSGGRLPFSLGEFRVVTTTYMMLRHPEYALPEDSLATLQDATWRLQSCLVRFEGQIYEIVPEEQGIVFIAVFGLPPWSHEDDAARAVRAALTLHREWGALGLTSSTGIATGRIFSGIFQTKTDRVVLALVGPIMNLAARLMQLNAGVVCDEGTRQSGRQSRRILARPLTPQTVKGKAEPIKAFAAYDVGGSTWPKRNVEELSLIGREREFSLLSEALAKARTGMSGVIIIEGDAGIGKTTFVNRVIAEASDEGMIVLAGGGDSTDETTTYLAWRRVFQDLLAQSDLPLRAPAARFSSSGLAVDSAQDHLGKTTIRLASAFAREVPLLEDMLGLEAVDNNETGLLRGQTRADALVRLLRGLLLAAASSKPIVIVIDDMHWLDPTSLSFFAHMGASRAPLILIGATRGPDATSAVRRSLAQVDDVQWLRLECMNVAETGSLVARTLGARSADDDLAAMFRERTGGNPLFVEELSKMALANRILFVDGTVQTRSTAAAAKGDLDRILERQGLPSTIEGVIQRRLNGLSHHDVSVLRAASVVGQTFDIELCSAGAPTSGLAAVERSLAALTGLGVIEPSDRAPGEFVFRHAVLRDVVYNSMSFTERRQLHDSIGSCIEERPHTEDISALLGRHFFYARRADKAIRYLIAAGEIAIRHYANEEAVELLTRADELVQGPADTGADGGMSNAERAHLSRLLGRAFLGLMRCAECQTHSEIGLRLAGFPAPASSLRIAVRLLAQTVRLFSYHVWHSRPKTQDPEKTSLREAVLAFEALAEASFYQGDGLRTLYAAMSALNLSEGLGPSPELARGCATLSGIAALFRLRRISDHYSARALETLVRIEDLAADVWVLMLLGIAKFGEGKWEEARTHFINVVAAAASVGDRRRWRDGVDCEAVIGACRGDWKASLDGLGAMLESARQDKDRRCTVVAYRERAYCYLQLGDLCAVDEHLLLIKKELDRGVMSEELSTRQDLHAIAATTALERGDYVMAAREASAEIKIIAQISGTGSFPNAYWTSFLVARVFANLWASTTSNNLVDRDVQRGMAVSCRALSSQAWSHPIAAPSAAIARGYLAQLRGRPTIAVRNWRRAAAEANRLSMDYECRLAASALGGASGSTDKISGLPFLAVGTVTDA